MLRKEFHPVISAQPTPWTPHTEKGKAKFLLSSVPLVLLASCDNKAAEPLSGLAGYPHKENSEGPVFNKERLSWAPPEATAGGALPEEPGLPLTWP